MVIENEILFLLVVINRRTRLESIWTQIQSFFANNSKINKHFVMKLSDFVHFISMDEIKHYPMQKKLFDSSYSKTSTLFPREFKSTRIRNTCTLHETHIFL